MAESILKIDVDHEFAAPGFRLDASLQCGQGWNVLFGPSGAGKSSVLRCVAGILRPRSGKISFGEKVWLDTSAGISLTPQQRNVGYVAQDPLLFSHLTVAENVAFGRRYSTAGGNIPALLNMFHCAHLAARRPHDLSGGEQQRVALARALARHPQLLLLDEPFRGMDAELRSEILQDLGVYLADKPTPVLSVTHDLIEIFSVRPQIFRMANGSVIDYGDARELLKAERDAILRALES